MPFYSSNKSNYFNYLLYFKFSSIFDNVCFIAPIQYVFYYLLFPTSGQMSLPNSSIHPVWRSPISFSRKPQDRAVYAFLAIPVVAIFRCSSSTQGGSLLGVQYEPAHSYQSLVVLITTRPIIIQIKYLPNIILLNIIIILFSLDYINVYVTKGSELPLGNGYDN